MTNTPHMNQFRHSARGLTLTKQEREEVKELLEAKIRYPHAMSTLLSLQDSFVLEKHEKIHVRVHLVEAMHQAHSAHSWAFPRFSLQRFASIFSTCCCILLTSGGVLAYAAEDALPGDVLYTMKIAVNEPVVTLLQRTPEQAAEWAARKMERRLHEAQILVKTASFKKEISPEEIGAHPETSETIPRAQDRRIETEQKEELKDTIDAAPLFAIPTASKEESFIPLRTTDSFDKKKSEEQKPEETPSAPFVQNIPSETKGLLLGITEKQREEIRENLVKAGVPDTKIQLWIRAVQHTEIAPTDLKKKQDPDRATVHFPPSESAAPSIPTPPEAPEPHDTKEEPPIPDTAAEIDILKEKL